MPNLIRTNSENPDFIKLVNSLDEYLAITDGDEHAFYDQYNQLAEIKHVVIAYEGNSAVACGAFKEYDSGTVEIKRMYTSEKCRGKGLATKILNDLEIWAAELNYSSCILETGKRQVEAIKLYQKNNYELFPNYGQYSKMENSLCFKKYLMK